MGARLVEARPREHDLERRRVRAALRARLLDEPSRPPQIGRYILQRPIGAGAMGVVYSALDPALDRNVAIKVLQRSATGDDTAQRKLVGEAHALARLSDPNIVPIYDAGDVDGQLWIAMELVEGTTLRAWINASSRSWSEVTAVLLAAGRGLAAAHAGGLVHRDFKPENIMVGRDGRVRVMDFGLALLLGQTQGEPTAGTPAYMAGELFEGRPATALSDQFAFCATFDEALRWRGAGDTGPSDSVPSWLSSVVRRGLAADPGRRWDSMADLLTALKVGRGRARRRRTWAWVGVGAAVVGVVVATKHVEQRHREEECGRSGDAVAQFWNPDARGALVSGIGSVDVPHAQTTATAVADIFEKRADEWAEARVSTCSAADGNSSDATLQERARWCLEDLRFEFQAQLQVLTESDRTAANRAYRVASLMRSPADCLDPTELNHQLTVPADRRAAVAKLRERLAMGAARLGSGANDGGIESARALIADAETVGWAPLAASARVLYASFLHKSGEYDDAVESAQAAYFQALRTPAWHVAADAAILIVGIAADRQDQELGRTWSRHARAALGHVGEEEGLRAKTLLNNLAMLRSAAGKYDEARSMHEQALQVAATIFGEGHLETSSSMLNLATVEYELGDYARSRQLLERTLEIRRRALGPDHFDVSIALGNLATVLNATDHPAEALELQEQVLVIQEANLGSDHPRITNALNNLAISNNRGGRYERARELHERSLSIRESRLGPEHPRVATSLDNLSQVYVNLGDADKAIELLERALEIRERALGPDHTDVADTLNNLGARLIERGDRAEARPMVERSLAIRESALGSEHPMVAVSLTNLAALEDELPKVLEIDRRILSIREAALGPNHPQVARALTNLALDAGFDADGSLELLERAVEIFDDHEGEQPRESVARFGLARALVNSGGDAVRARKLAREALQGHRAASNAKAVARVESWLSDAPR